MVLDAEQIEGWEHGTQVRGNDRGPWSQTHGGHKFHPLNPDPAALTLEDIAHQLAMVNRFSGATAYPYSVAQHTMLCVAIVDAYFTGNRRLRRWALLHDAPEYVLGDMVRPVKVLLPSYAEMEERLHAVIAERFKLEPLNDIDTGTMRYVDSLACVIEKRALLPNAVDWHGMPTYVKGFDDLVCEQSWRKVKWDLLIELKREFE